MKDLLAIITLTVVTCLAVGVVGALVLHLVRRKSLRYQLTIATLLPLLAVVATVMINVRLMFISGHDSTVILIGLLTSVLLAVLGAWLVLRQITRASREVGAGLAQLVADTSTADGTPAPAAGSTPARSSAGVPQELAAVIDELAETRRTLAESRARERTAEQSRRELVSFMSHDLRTPLAGLRALAEGLEDGVISDVPRALSPLRGTVGRMTVLVDDLFALSRVQGGGDSVKPQSLVSLTELIGDVASESAATAAAQGVLLTADLPDDRLALVGSSDDLARVLANLVSNAVRHTENGGTVRIEAGRTDDQVRVAVIDGCGGIPGENLARVFDAGWRGTPSRGGDDGGAGLGLAIARAVVESHDGRISVRNVDGGCRFDVVLPAAPSASRG